MTRLAAPLIRDVRLKERTPMLGPSTLTIFEKAITALNNDLSKEKSKVGIVFKNIIGHPVKVFASFIAAPFLVIKIACVVKNPIRRAIAIIGLLLSIVFAYLSATFLGSVVGAVFVASNIGILMGIGFFFGTTLSVFLSVDF